MMNQIDIKETIAAVATAPGEAALAIVRLTGQDALKVGLRVLHPREKVSSDCEFPQARRAILCEARHPQSSHPIDEVMAIFYEAPKSYTGENMVEIICHGGASTTDTLLDACLAGGARAAQPGEFTLRAFINGKMDLAQAEAVADLIHSRTEAARQTALRQLEGGLSASIAKLRELLLNAAAEIEARLDFPEEDIEPADAQRINADMTRAGDMIVQLLVQGSKGRRLREGVRVAIVGRPNVGKSSLFNALVGMERALVTIHAGTTRDTIEATIDLRGLEVTYIDTAGFRPNADEVESLGIERARREVERADFTLCVLNSSEPLQSDDEDVLAMLEGRPFSLILNKCDLDTELDTGSLISSRPEFAAAKQIFTSTKTKDGLNELEDMLLNQLGASPTILSGGVILTNARHIDALKAADEMLARSRSAFAKGEPGELVMIDLRDAINALGSITGESIGEEILDRIFSTFCIGK